MIRRSSLSVRRVPRGERRGSASGLLRHRLETVGRLVDAGADVLPSLLLKPMLFL